MYFGSDSFSYDAVGNPTHFRGMTCTWERDRQLKTLSDGTNTVTYNYDAFGYRSSKVVGEQSTVYTYENGRLVREVKGSDTITYVYGQEGVIGFILNGTPYIYRKNLFGDVTEIYNTLGNAVGKYNYSAFGEVEIEVDTNGIATKNPIRYNSDKLNNLL